MLIVHDLGCRFCSQQQLGNEWEAAQRKAHFQVVWSEVLSL